VSLVCTLKAISTEEAAALRTGSKTANELRALAARREPLPCGCAVISLPLFAGIIAMLWRLAPSLLWLWFAAFGLMWVLLNGLHWRLWNAIRRPAKADPQAVAPALPAPQGDELYLDKAWHGLHYLLTGGEAESAAPLGYLLSGGEEIGDLPAGPARLLSPTQTREFHEAVFAFTPEDLRRRFDAERMQALGVYPNNWKNPGELDWLIGAFERLQSFLSQQVAASDRWLIISLG